MIVALRGGSTRPDIWLADAYVLGWSSVGAEPDAVVDNERPANTIASAAVRTVLGMSSDVPDLSRCSGWC